MLGEYLADGARRGLAVRTLSDRRYVVGCFEKHAGRPLVDASMADVEAFLSSRQLGPQGRHTYLCHIRAVYRWALAREMIDRDPTSRIEKVRLPRRFPRPIHNDPLAAALNAAGPRMRCWLALAAFEGLRCHEIAGVRGRDVMASPQGPLLVVSTAKGRKERVLPIHPFVLELLKDLIAIEPEGPLFLRRSGEPVTAHDVSRQVSDFLHAMGINATAHQLRHWFGTTIYQQSNDLRLCQDLLGHASPVTTALYTAYSPVSAARAIASLAVPLAGA